jgi:hypothetical protein
VPPIRLINLFWSVPFYTENRHWWEGFNQLGKTKLKSYPNWEKTTKKNPQKIMQIDWPLSTTLRQGLSEIFLIPDTWYDWGIKTAEK